MASRKCAEIAGTGRRITRTGMRGKWLICYYVEKINGGEGGRIVPLHPKTI